VYLCICVNSLSYNGLKSTRVHRHVYVAYTCGICSNQVTGVPRDTWNKLGMFTQDVRRRARRCTASCVNEPLSHFACSRCSVSCQPIKWSNSASQLEPRDHRTAVNARVKHDSATYIRLKLERWLMSDIMTICRRHSTHRPCTDVTCNINRIRPHLYTTYTI